MITQFEVATYLENEIPEIKTDFQNATGPAINNIYLAIKCLAQFTRRMVLEHNDLMTRRCLTVATKLYKNGNNNVKNAVENIYVYSFSSLLNSCADGKARNKLQARLPVGLYKIYLHQVNSSGI